MNPALTTFILACCSAAISGQINCTDKSDGAYGSGCRSYTKCEGGIGTLIDCLLNEEAFNYLTGKCQPIEDVPLPCGSSKNDCDKKMMESTLYFQSAPISTPAPITNSSEQTHATTLPMETFSFLMKAFKLVIGKPASLNLVALNLECDQSKSSFKR